VKKNDGSTSVEKALDILGCFDPEEPEIGVSHIARRLGIGASTAHRLLKLMMKRDFVRQNPATSKYSLGFRVVHLASTVVGRSAIRSAALPRMVALRDATGERVLLHLLSGRDRVCIEEIRGAVDDAPPVLGHAHPLYIGPAGHVFMAHLPDHDARQVLAEGQRSGQLSAHDAATLSRRLDDIRLHGFALGRHGRPVQNSLAVPVRNFTGAVIAVIAIEGTPSRWSDRRMRSFTAEAIEEAASASIELGYMSRAAFARPAARRPRRARRR
jgi:DNA-binding IclR family transcriptional regulator